MIRIYVLMIFLWLIGTTGWAQSAYRFRHVGVEDGLSQGSIFHMHKDSRGFMWLGTQDGINRFDGKNIQIYLSGASGESTNTQGIAEDSAGNLWVGSHKGLFHYIRKKNKFVSPSVKNLPAKGSFHVFNNRKKQIFLLDENGLYQLKNNTATLLTKALRYNRSQFSSFVTESPDGDIWLIDANEGLIRYQISSNRTTYYFSGDAKNTYGKPETFDCLSFDRAGNLWLGGNQGLILFDHVAGKTRTFKAEFQFDQHALLDITEDNNGLLWLGTEGNGIIIFDPKTEKIVQRLRHEDDVVNSLKFNEVSKIFIDENNDVFVNTDPQGLDIITTVPSAFNHYTFSRDVQVSLSSYSVRGIAEDGGSGIWIGTELGGLNRLNTNTGEIKNYSTKDGLPQNTIRFILRDEENQLWVATSYGFFVFRPEINKFQSVKLPIPCEVTNILSVGKNRLLLTTNKGLMLFDSKRMIVTGSLYKSLVGGYTSYMDKNSGTIYVSDRHHGLHTISIANEVIRPGKVILSDYHILKIYHTPNKPYFWAASEKGLIKWSMKENKIIKIYGVKDGLHHEYIYAVLPDGNGNLWLSTNRGLTRFNPENERFEFIKELPPREYNSRASLATQNGDLYFGSTTGLDRIKPNLLTLRNDQVGVQLTDLAYDSPAHENDSLYIGELAALTLPFTHNTISLKFAAIDYRSGGLNRFRYFLQGYDQDTIYAGTADQVRYARLPAGSYEFNLQASDLGGNWVSPVRKLAITVLPPFWQRWWFILLIGTLVACLVFLTIERYLSNKLKAQKSDSERQISLEKERSRIARDMNDSLGSDLFGLKLLGMVALSQTSKEDANSYIQRIVDASKSISEKISEVIWLTDSGQDNAESLWNYIQKNASIYLRPSGIDYHFEALPDSDISNVSGERRHELLNFYKQLFVELSKTCNLPQCKITFSISQTDLGIEIENADVTELDKSLFTNLEKLRGVLQSHEKAIDTISIPLSD
jgi:ligand-binding sensor domain-containing protein